MQNTNSDYLIGRIQALEAVVAALLDNPETPAGAAQQNVLKEVLQKRMVNHPPVVANTDEYKDGVNDTIDNLEHIAKFLAEGLRQD